MFLVWWPMVSSVMKVEDHFSKSTPQAFSVGKRCGLDGMTFSIGYDLDMEKVPS